MSLPMEVHRTEESDFAALAGLYKRQIGGTPYLRTNIDHAIVSMTFCNKDGDIIGCSIFTDSPDYTSEVNDENRARNGIWLLHENQKYMTSNSLWLTVFIDPKKTSRNFERGMSSVIPVDDTC
eukprot:189015_1